MSFFHSLLSSGSTANINNLLDNRPYVFDASNLTTMFVETAVGAPLTQVVADGDLVGTFYSKGFGGYHVRTAANTNKPTFKNQGGICYIQWATGNTALADNSIPTRDYVRPMHAVTPSYRIGILMRIDTDSLSKEIFTTKTIATSQAAGLHFRHNTTGTFFVREGDGTNTRVNVTATSGSKTVASGWFYLFWDQSGVNCRFGLDNMTAPQAITATGVGADVAASQGFQFGAPGMSIAKFVVENGLWDTTSVNAFKAEPTTVNSNQWASVRVEFDYNTDCYSDTTWTTPAVNNGPIRGLKNKRVSPFGPITARNATSTADAASPTFLTANLNGRGVADWDGTGNALLTFGEDLFPDNSGSAFMVMLSRNEDANFGSHWLHGGDYYVWTGENWPGQFTDDYHTTHTNNGTGPSGQLLKTFGQQWNISAFYRHGGTWEHWNGSYVKTTTTITGTFTAIRIGGSSQGADWYPDGKTAYLIVYTGNFGDDYKKAELKRISDLGAL